MAQDGSGADRMRLGLAMEKVQPKLAATELAQWLTQDDNNFIKSVQRRFGHEIKAAIRKNWRHHLPEDVLEEIYNDVLLNISRAKSSLRPERAETLGGLIYTIAAKRTLDRLKKTGRIKRKSEVNFGDIQRYNQHGEEQEVEYKDATSPTTGSRAEVNEEATALQRWAAAAYAMNVIDTLDLDIIVYSLKNYIDFTNAQERRTLAKHFRHLDNKDWHERLARLTDKVREARENDFELEAVA